MVTGTQTPTRDDAQALTVRADLEGRVKSQASMLKRLQAKYDAAQNPRHLENYWGGLTDTAANAELTPSVRSTIRKRARYECRNNSWVRGMVDTRAHYTIGTMPRPQVTGASQRVASEVETAWRQWAHSQHFGEMLRSVMVQVSGETGEDILVMSVEDDGDGPRLVLTEVEADRLTTPQVRVADAMSSPTYEDGITYDAEGRPIRYDIMRYHPGESWGGASDEYQSLPPDRVLHLYRRIRPGQRRGIPDLTPALPMFAMLRRFAVATVVAAETSADIAAFLYTTSDSPAEGVAFDLIDLELGSLMTAPPGWQPAQMKQEHPSTTYEMFTKLALNECARCLQMPLNVAMMNSANYNYASGRMDYQAFYKAITVDQDWLVTRALMPIFSRWYEIEVFAGRLPSVSFGVGWFFDGLKHVDPVKEASAQDIRLNKAGTSTLAREYAAEGLDWEEELRQRSRERVLQMQLAAEEKRIAEELGITQAPEPEVAEPEDADTGRTENEGDVNAA